MKIKLEIIGAILSLGVLQAACGENPLQHPLYVEGPTTASAGECLHFVADKPQANIAGEFTAYVNGTELSAPGKFYQDENCNTENSYSPYSSVSAPVEVGKGHFYFKPSVAGQITIFFDFSPDGYVDLSDNQNPFVIHVE